MGRLFAIAALLICLVYLGTHPQVVRWGFGVVTAPLNAWMDNPDRQQLPLGGGKDLERKVSSYGKREKRTAREKAGKAKEELRVRAVAIQKARGL